MKKFAEIFLEIASIENLNQRALHIGSFGRLPFKLKIIGESVRGTSGLAGKILKFIQDYSKTIENNSTQQLIVETILIKAFMPRIEGAAHLILEVLPEIKGVDGSEAERLSGIICSQLFPNES